MAVFLPSDTSTIRYEETDLASLHSRPSHFVCGVYLICVRGTAVVSTGVQQYALGEQTELIFLTGSRPSHRYPLPELHARTSLLPSYGG